MSSTTRPSTAPSYREGFPGLRVWLTIKTFGAARLRAAIAEKRALAVAAAERLARVPGIALVAPPQLSLFAFRLEPPGASPAAQDEATRRLLERVNARGQVMLTGCTVDERFLARVCVLSFRTRRRHVETAVEQIIEETAAILAEGLR